MPNNTIWNIESIKAGFERFLKENGRLPTAREIDKCGYLLTSRQIQRRFGGLEKLRAILNFSITNYSKGENRSKIATTVNIRGKASEDVVKQILIDKFGEKFVHIERPFHKVHKNRFDFYVFSPSGDYGVDVFYPKDLDSMVNSLNIKSKIYQECTDQLYLVVANDNIKQDRIDFVIRNKKNVLKNNLIVLSIENFKLLIATMRIYKEIAVGNNDK